MAAAERGPTECWWGIKYAYGVGPRFGLKNPAFVVWASGVRPDASMVVNVTIGWRNEGGSKGVWGLVNKWVRMGRPVSEGKRDLFAFI